MEKRKLKRLVLFTTMILVVLAGSLVVHSALSAAYHWNLGADLKGIYFFFGFGSLVVYYLLEWALSYKPQNVAYVFLGGILAKLGLFSTYFLLEGVELNVESVASRLMIVVPMMIFLAIEGWAARVCMSAVSDPTE